LVIAEWSSLAGVAEGSQTANVLAIVNAHRTDEDGAIEFIKDGERLWMEMGN
jgi:hypothetical protein